MSIRILDTVSGGTFIFPMPPESVKFSAGTKFIEYELMKTGDVAIPFGEELSKITFDGIFPGENRKDMPFVTNWKNPSTIQEMLSAWRNKGTKLRITIDDTPINHGVYLQNYEVEYSGGFGDYKYSLAFITAKEIEITIEPKLEAEDTTEEKKEDTINETKKQYVTVTGNRVNVRNKASTSGKIIFVAKKGEQYEYAGKKSGNWYYIVAKGGKYWISSRYSKLSAKKSSSSSKSTSSSKTHTVKKGDTLWAIAQKYYGSGSKYTKIKTANNLKSNTIYVGQKLKIP